MSRSILTFTPPSVSIYLTTDTRYQGILLPTYWIFMLLGGKTAAQCGAAATADA
jgi:hypothetical protein